MIASSVRGEMFTPHLRRRVHRRRRAGRRSRAPPATAMPGTRRRPTSVARRTSTASSWSRRAIADIEGARCLVSLGDSVTTDHISPAGAIRLDSPAGRYLTEHGVELRDFNSYGSRRGNHEVMLRGTFANVRLRNLLVPGSEGTWTKHFPSGEEMSDLRRVRALPGRRNAARRPRGQGVRLRLVPRLGREGPGPTRCPRGDRRELRADPPLEPADDGHPPAAVRSRRVARVARADRRGGVRVPRASRAAMRARSRSTPAARRSPRSSASTPRASASTSSTAGSCRTCCGGSAPSARPDQPSEMRARYGLVRVAAATKRDDLAELLPGHPLDDELVAAELLGDGDDAEVVRNLEVVEARAAVGAEALVGAEPGGERGDQRVALAAVLAVELLADLELARSARSRGDVRRGRAARGERATDSDRGQTAAIGRSTAMRRRRFNPKTR